MGRNFIATFTDLGGGMYEIILDHAITAGAVTTIQYKGGGDYIEFASHQANTDPADNLSGPSDILALIDCCLNDACIPLFGVYSCDIDHSNLTGPADMLRILMV